LFDGCDLTGEGLDTILTDVVAKILNGGQKKLTFFLLYPESMFLQTLEHFLERFQVTFFILPCDKDIINVTNDPRYSLQDLIHHLLE